MEKSELDKATEIKKSMVAFSSEYGYLAGFALLTAMTVLLAHVHQEDLIHKIKGATNE